MRGIDLLLARCPLKHEIRCALWEKYARKVVGARPLRNYLTLYSPPMIDVKHFARQRLIQVHDGTYRGVTAVTWDDEAYADAVSGVPVRPELLLRGNINDLLDKRRGEEPAAGQLRAQFPFEAINLDYCNSLYDFRHPNVLSGNLKAIEEIACRQERAGMGRFALFITTRAEDGSFAQPFLDDLASRLDENIRNNREFGRKFSRHYGKIGGTHLLRANYRDFVMLGLLKLVANTLATRRFETTECDAALLIRDRTPKEGPQWLLHMAFLATARDMPRAGSLRSLGRGVRRGCYFERNVARFVGSTVLSISETASLKPLGERHQVYLDELNSETADLSVPEPEPGPGP